MRTCGAGRWAAVVALIVQFGGLTAESVSTSATLEWAASPDPTVVGYYIYFGQRSGAYDKRIDVGNVTNATVADLAPGVTNYFVAIAYDKDRTKSLPSNEITDLIFSTVTMQLDSNNATHLVFLVLPQH